MTLKDWTQDSGYVAWPHKLGARYVHDTASLDRSGFRTRLWCLTDYRVSSVTGGTIWLVAR